jgi:hypothetical protein
MTTGSALAVEPPRPQPLVVKVNHPGYVLPQHRRTEICELYQDHIDITVRTEEGSTTERRPVEIRSDLAALVSAARTADITSTENFLCDGPSTAIYLADDEATLYSTGGCGSPRRERQGQAAAALIDIIVAYCPVVH